MALITRRGMPRDSEDIRTTMIVAISLAASIAATAAVIAATRGVPSYPGWPVAAVNQGEPPP